MTSSCSWCGRPAHVLVDAPELRGSWRCADDAAAERGITVTEPVARTRTGEIRRCFVPGELASWFYESA